VLAALGAAAAAVFVAAQPPGARDAAGDVYRDIDRFVSVLQHIRNYYVDETDDEELIRGAIKRMLADLDPHTQYLDGTSLSNLKVGTTGKYSGVGMEISTRRGHPVVVSPMEGTPAERAGLRTGDVIVNIDGHETYGMLLQDVSGALKGPAGTSVTLTVQRRGETGPIDFKVVRDVIHIPNISMCTVIEPGIGYVRMNRFAAGTAKELSSCLDRLEGEGITGLIVDLRGNPGGLLLEATRACEQFLPEGKLVVSTRGRVSGESVEYLSRSSRTRVSLPMVVLVDGGTASAAEIVAGAIQDWDLGLIVGEVTFGKGSVQRVMELGGSQALKLTTSYYYTPSGRCIHNRAKEEGEATAGESGAPNGTYDSADTTSAGGGEVEEYFTAGGRVVRGGGGIAPDVRVKPVDLSRFERTLERRGLFFDFAVDYAGKNPDLALDGVTPETIESFREFILDEGVSFDEGEFESAREFMTLGIRRELARRTSGDEGARLVAMEGDRAVGTAVRLLKEAKRPRDLFELAAQYNGDRR
jgi:carboxyl-terminal processing protease